MVFRFFVNVDKCLNMYNFDFFFYRKQSSHELHLTPDVCIGEGTGKPFREAASDIRMYLDRFSHDISDYQIIIAMRDEYKSSVSSWRDTLLSGLLDIDFDLRQSNIFIRSGHGQQIAVNLVVLHEANTLRTIHAVDDPYMNSNRLADDCKLLLREIGVPEDKENDLDAIKSAWTSYVETNSEMFENCPKTEDGKPAHSLYSFFTDLINQYEKDKRSATANVSTFQALKEVLNGYQIFEMITDKQNINKYINTLLKVVEFSTVDFDTAVGMEKTMTLTEMCAVHWRKIAGTDDSVIREKYAKMLTEYQNRLNVYIANAPSGSFTFTSESTLPKSTVPSDDDISITESIFESEGAKRSKQIDPKALVKNFKNKLSPVSTLLGRWESTYKQISDIFGKLEYSLEEYSDQLAKEYTQKLEIRKKDEREWHKKSYAEDENTQREIEELTLKEGKLLDKMNEPQMTPSLGFQDQLNMETALEQENYNIKHYIKCMQSVSVKNFFLLILLLIGLVSVMYALLQPYDFQSTTTALYFAGYIGACLVLMLFTWRLPLNYYRRRLHNCLTNLEKEMDKYITGYFDRAEQLHEYINSINALDYIERHLHLKKRAVKTTKWIVNARNWHIGQAMEHLKKLAFFAGLMSTYKPSHSYDGSENKLTDIGPAISRDHIDDVIDSKLYWPQV